MGIFLSSFRPSSCLGCSLGKRPAEKCHATTLFARLAFSLPLSQDSSSALARHGTVACSCQRLLERFLRHRADRLDSRRFGIALLVQSSLNFARSSCTSSLVRSPPDPFAVILASSIFTSLSQLRQAASTLTTQMDSKQGQKTALIVGELAADFESQ